MLHFKSLSNYAVQQYACTVGECVLALGSDSLSQPILGLCMM